MKKIYFVRHGESEGNIGPFRQGAAAPLTEKGRKQAAYVADRCAKLPIEAIVCSSMIRAKETADFIVKKIDKKVSYSDLFVERRRSSVVTGKNKKDPIALDAEEQIKKNFCVPDWRYSDEENFEDLKSRALKALGFLMAQPEENILVVTHGFFLRIILVCMIFGESLQAPECQLFIQSTEMENTGLTIFDYDQSRPHPWCLWVWNDHAHLG